MLKGIFVILNLHSCNMSKVQTKAKVIGQLSSKGWLVSWRNNDNKYCGVCGFYYNDQFVTSFLHKQPIINSGYSIEGVGLVIGVCAYLPQKKEKKKKVGQLYREASSVSNQNYSWDNLSLIYYIQ